MSSYERWIDWWEEALDDLATAKDLLKLHRYSKACFFSHQACEKALKALMIKEMNRYELIHSVAELLKRLNKVLSVPEDLIRKGEILDKFYIPTRYPNTWPYGAPYKHFTGEDAELAIKCAEEVIEFVKGVIERKSTK